MIPYRVRQVWNLFHRRLIEEEVAWVQAWLSPAQQALFFAQEPGDQAHALTVARTLHAQGHRDARLMQAALLHDTGKAPGVSLPYRTAIVLLKRVARDWLSSLSPNRADWLAPLARAWHHPALGADLARRATSHPDVIALIAHHQSRSAPLADELQPLLAALQAVDDAS